ncbi:MAG: hypothetical protein LBQ88_02670 [Treponema sp.]|jgi:exonuclease VII small subunit|nr:hypothetical protein [Treponema sp.]
MNKERRKAIESCIEKINAVRDDLDNLKSEEEDYLDNMPDSFRNSDKGNMADNAISNLEEAINQLEEAVSSAESALE